MRENPDTSLRIMQLLANEDFFPSRLTEQDISRELEVGQVETIHHLYLLADGGFIEAETRRQGFLSGERVVQIGHIYGLTSRGQEYVRQAESRNGKLLTEAKEVLRKAKSALTTQAIAKTLEILTSRSLGGG